MDMSGSLWVDEFESFGFSCGVGLKLLIIFSSDKLTKGSIMLKQADVASGADFLQVMAESGVRKREGFLRGSGYWRHQSRASSRFPGDQTSVGDGRVQDSQRSVLLPQSRLRCCCAVKGWAGIPSGVPGGSGDDGDDGDDHPIMVMVIDLI